MEKKQTREVGGKLADAAAERVREVIAAAESTAAEIVADARTEAERIRAEARAESEQTVTAANREATGRIEHARGAVEGLISQADKLRAQVGALGKDLASNIPGSGRPAAEAPPDEVEPESLGVPDGAPEPIRPADDRSTVASTDDELISRLRGSAGPGPAVEKAEAAPADGTDDGAARLVAMNMALDGASRAEMEGRMEADFPAVGDREALLDDVLSRAGR